MFYSRVVGKSRWIALFWIYFKLKTFKTLPRAFIRNGVEIYFVLTLFKKEKKKKDCPSRGRLKFQMDIFTRIFYAFFFFEVEIWIFKILRYKLWRVRCFCYREERETYKEKERKLYTYLEMYILLRGIGVLASTIRFTSLLVSTSWPTGQKGVPKQWSLWVEACGSGY